MSEFWKYFHDRLAWPLIHAPGPLSGLVRGMALALDSARDDIVYFRRQWFPGLCEAGLVPDFGAGRGLVRHPKETAEQFRARVVTQAILPQVPFLFHAPFQLPETTRIKVSQLLL